MPKIPDDLKIHYSWLQQAMKAKNYSAARLASELAVHPSTITRVTSGTTKGMSRVVWYGYLHAMGLGKDWRPSAETLEEADATPADDEPTTGHSRVAVSSDEGSPA
jgi:transcriptional regulator with XRE-family HTH domain